MSSVTSNPLFKAGALGMFSSGLIESARALESSIGVPLSPFLPSQGTNAIVFGSSAALVAAAIAGKVFCSSKPISSEKKPVGSYIAHKEMEQVEVVTTKASSANQICIRVAGRSRAGKSLWIEQFFGGLRTCKNPSFFRGTELATKYMWTIGKMAWEVTDTPGLYESDGDGQTARSNEVILEQIRPNPNEVVDAVIYTLPEAICRNDIESIIAVYNNTPKEAKVFLLITQCEKIWDLSIGDIKHDRLCQLIENDKHFPPELLEKLKNCPVILSGAINVDEQLYPDDILNQVETIYKFNDDARRLLVPELIKNQEEVAQCIARLAEPFQVPNQGNLESIADYISYEADTISSFKQNLEEKVSDLEPIINEFVAIIENHEKYSQLRDKLRAIANTLKEVATKLPKKVEEFKSIANKLRQDHDFDCALKELNVKAEEFKSQLWDKVWKDSKELSQLCEKLAWQEKSLDHSKLQDASKDLNEFLENNYLKGAFNFVTADDLNNRLGYLALALKIMMKKFVPNMPKWDSRSSLNPARVANSNLEG